MADCYEGMRAALRRNIEGLAALTPEQKEGLLATEMAAAIAATESGRPFVEIYGQETATDDANDYEAETPAETRPARKAAVPAKA